MINFSTITISLKMFNFSLKVEHYLIQAVIPLCYLLIDRSSSFTHIFQVYIKWHLSGQRFTGIVNSFLNCFFFTKIYIFMSKRDLILRLCLYFTLRKAQKWIEKIPVNKNNHIESVFISFISPFYSLLSDSDMKKLEISSIKSRMNSWTHCNRYVGKSYNQRTTIKLDIIIIISSS